MGQLSYESLIDFRKDDTYEDFICSIRSGSLYENRRFG